SGDLDQRRAVGRALRDRDHLAVVEDDDAVGNPDVHRAKLSWPAWSPSSVPGDDDDKYSRGVVGFVTGSASYPGAAVLGVEAAARTGVGMIRYLGPGRPTRLVLQRRPEVVTA